MVMNIWNVDDVDNFEHEENLLGDPNEVKDPVHEVVFINEEDDMSLDNLEDEEELEDEDEEVINY